MSRSPDQADVLRRKASDDAWVARKLMADPQSPLWTVGFHPQQAIEKLIKAVLCDQAAAFPFSHDLEELLEVIKKKGLSLPPQAERLAELSVFAAAFRYDDLTAVQDVDRAELIRDLAQLLTSTEACTRFVSWPVACLLATCQLL